MDVCNILQVMGRRMNNQEPRVYWYVLPSRIQYATAGAGLVYPVLDLN